jgi:single-strand DNA-binding protein
MRGINKCEFIGNLAADLKVNYSQNKRAVTTGRIACGEVYKDQSGEWHEKPTFVPFVIYGDRGPRLVEQGVRKGYRLYVSGAFQSRSVQAKDSDGEAVLDSNGKPQMRYFTEIRATYVESLRAPQGRQGATTEDEPPPPDDFSDDVL